MAESREHDLSRRPEGGPLRPPPASSPARMFHPSLPTGMGLGKYRILERIKTTHNAVIYKARDMMLDRLVTIKQMSPALIDDPIACGHFRREAQFLARVPRGTSHVIGIHELIEDDLGLFIVEEHLLGDWLEALIAKRRIDLTAALRILKTTALGLRTLHSMRVAHRGIHPGNILVTRNGKAKITNLSTASYESDTTPPPVIAPKYTAPELLLGDEYDDRVDIYSLGFVLFEMCVGRPALNRHFADLLIKPAEAKARWIEWHLDPRTSLPNASDLNPLVPPHLAVLIRRMTAKNLDERMASIQEVLRALAPATAERHAPPPLGAEGWAGPQILWLPDGALAVPAYAAQPQLGAPGVPASRRLPSPYHRSAAQTSTCTVRVDHADQPSGEPRSDAAPQSAPRPKKPATPKSPSPARSRSRRHGAAVRPPPRVEVPQAPEAPLPTPKEKSSGMLRWLVAAGLALILLTGGGGLAWWYFGGSEANSPAAILLREADQARESGNLDLAEQKYGQSAAMALASRRESLQSAAEIGLLLVEADRAIGSKRFDDAEAKLAEAKRRGGDLVAVETLEDKLFKCKDVCRTLATTEEELSKGNFAKVEASLEELEKKARASGEDPDQLRARLEQARRDKKYADCLERAKKALSQNDYDQALQACKDAESVKSTSAARQLHKRIDDLKKRAEYTVRGDDAMLSKDYRAAQAAYETANLLEASAELEKRVNVASACLLFEEAQAAIAAGDLLGAEDKLKTSMWKFPIPEVETKLKKLAPAFDAARLARNGDWAMQDQDYVKAIRLYTEALRDLPAPADSAVKTKLLKAQEAAGAQQKIADKPRG